MLVLKKNKKTTILRGMFSMYKSILQFNESGTIRLDNICADFFENPKDVASFVNGVKDEMLRFACEFIGDAFEEL